MNLTIKKLPKSVQSLICAANQINSYTKAVQELVYNSLDAEATSIAVRIHITEGSIQVVDNGCGISKADIKYIGQNYMTSKLFDITTLKSAPNKYGFQGQSLANLAQISETLKVVSRYYKCEITCVKIFKNGRTKSTYECSPRPSKGTTIEIKGFLYNLSIQRKSVDLINELQNIKTFLEHVSLVHYSISLSLRDDSKNEIVFKIHKNRDMYQTISTLYEIDKTKIKELQVEKNHYKVKAFLGKSNDEFDKQLIFLNGKFIHNSSRLHKKLNENLKKYIKGSKIKKHVNNNVENDEFRKKTPFYFLFITCPFMDYELTNTVLEFKDWGQINIIFDKLIKFYHDEVQMKTGPMHQITGLRKKIETESTRIQIDDIIQKILGSHSKKPEISQMQNGIKGKLIKRKATTKKKSLNLSKIIDSKPSNNRQKRSKHGSNKIILINEKRGDNDSSILKTPSKEGAVVNDPIKHRSASSFLKTNAKKTNRAKTQKQSHPKYATTSKNKTQTQNSSITKSKHYKNICIKKKISLNSKFALETESVKQRCELLAQKTKEFIKNIRNPKVFINENSQYICNNFMKNNKNIAIHKNVNEVVIREYIPLPPKSNIDIRARKNRNKSFKSNYDLLQTILSSQESDIFKKREKNALNDSIPAMVETEHSLAIEHEPENNRTSTLYAITPDCNLMNSFKELDDYAYHKETPCHVFRPFIRELDLTSPLQIKTPNQTERPCVREFNYETPLQALRHKHNILETGKQFLFTSVRNNYKSPSVIETDNISPLRAEMIHSNPNLFLTKSPSQAVTFQSHNYTNRYLQTRCDSVLKKFQKPRNFISTQSRENFKMVTKFPENIFKKNKNNPFSKLFNSNIRKRNKAVKMLKVDKDTLRGIRESYTIEFTESNNYNSLKGNDQQGMFCSENNATYKNMEVITPSMSFIFNDLFVECASPKGPETRYTPKNDDDFDYEPINGNTFNITNSYGKNNFPESFNHKHETYTIDKIIENSNQSFCGHETSDEIKDTSSNSKFVFISKTQENNDEITNPIDVCETILKDQELSIDKAREFDTSFNCIQDSSNNVSNTIQNELSDNIITDFHIIGTPGIYQKTLNQDFEEVSHHFTVPNSNILFKQSPIQKSKENGEIITNTHYQNRNETVADDNPNEKNKIEAAFNMKNRLFFVPKGMSPIFKDCQAKYDYDYDSKEDYYEDKIYNNFVEKVHNIAEIFKPNIQETASDLATKDLSKINDKLSKTNAFLKFDGLAIKHANVLGQIDNKFIAATMKSKCSKADDGGDEYLVLFDQHAVHERIRLENNLADYLNGSQWKSVSIDQVSLKLSRDDILYLHNYREKFMQFGLEWTILNYNEISLTAIPEGILGKNPRQVDKILKAVKCLITEEINIIQMQRGCVSLYPKSIMDLVFSEACRYAIKFGDRLTKSQCVELLNGLSDCKTPFQCAHGRPSMAVIMNIANNQTDFKIHYDKIKQFKKCIK